MRPFRMIALGVAALALVSGKPAAAADPYCRPWCLRLSGGGPGGGGGGNCGFYSFEQCKASAQGSDLCSINPFCPPGEQYRGGVPRR
jgi:hypothetical protein